MVLTTVHAMMHQMKNPVLVLGIGGFISVFWGLLVDQFRCLKGWMRSADGGKSGFQHQRLLFAGGNKLAALVVAAASGFRGGRIFPQCLSAWH